MAVPGTPEPKIILVRGDTLPQQPWWKALHSTINQAFKSKNHDVFPPSWNRLPENSKVAAQKLKAELGPNGVIAVVLLVDRPIACAGALPYRGLEWIDEANFIVKGPDGTQESNGDGKDNTTTTADEVPKDEDTPVMIPNMSLVPPSSAPGTDWELCCVCVHPIHRRVGLSPRLLRALIDHIKPLGARRLMASYAADETGHYWPNMGFEVVEGAGGLLKKGFTHTEGMEGLKQDVRIALGIKEL